MLMPLTFASPRNLSVGGIKFDGSQNYYDVGSMGNFGSSITSTLYMMCKFQTTNLAAYQALFGLFNTGTSTGLDFNLNGNAAGAFTAKFIRAFVRDSTGQTCNADNGGAFNFWDGEIHTLVVTCTFAVNTTLTITVDNIPQALTYANQNHLVTLGNFGFNPALGARNVRGTIGAFFNGTILAFQIGATASNIYASYVLDQSHGSPLADLMLNNSPLIAHGTPIPKQQPGRFFIPSAMRGL